MGNTVVYIRHFLQTFPSSQTPRLISTSWLLWIALHRCAGIPVVRWLGVLWIYNQEWYIWVRRWCVYFSVSWGNFRLIFTVARAAYILTGSIQVFPLSNILTNICCGLFDFYFVLFLMIVVPIEARWNLNVVLVYMSLIKGLRAD